MDTTILFQAVQSGNVNYLKQLLSENPLILNCISLYSTENPLHIASIAGQIDFVKEIVRLKPEYAKEINQDGFSPMHFAAAIGHAEIVRELMNVDRGLCRLEGKDKMTPLHCAAIKGRVEVISVMLTDCPDCIENVTVQGATALHLAVKNKQFEAVKIMVDWIREMKKEDMLNTKEEQGNTVLHLAIWKKERQVVEWLLDIGTGSLEVNAINHCCLTALDVLLIFPSEAGDREIVEILQTAGAVRARDLTRPNGPHNPTFIDTPTSPQTGPSHPRNLVEYFKFKKGRDPPSEARGTLLVIAVLVATTTFQVGVSPPGGVWQDTVLPDQTNGTSTDQVHTAGESVLATTDGVAFALFVFFNSVGFTVSLFMISILTTRFPLRFELFICIFAMFATYNTALQNITPAKLELYVLLLTSTFSVLVPLLARLTRENIEKLREFTGDMIHRVV